MNNGVTSAYTYTRDNEVLNLVHTWTGGDATYIYGFDGNGRRTNLRISNDVFDPWLSTTPSLALTSNNLNQLTSIGGTPLGYDLNGNLLNDGTHIYTHDAVNRLASADGTITYAYDALGRRVSKTVNGTVTKYVYDGARVIAEYDGAGQLLRKYVYGPGLDEPVLMQSGATRYYYLFDSLGSVIGLTDASGGLVEAYRYNMYGQPLQASTVGNPYMFTGRRFDSETGLYYYRNRYYSPQLRRFIEPDPIGFEGGMNLYAYVGNDPVNAIDPWGFESVIIFKTERNPRRDPSNPWKNAANYAARIGHMEYGAIYNDLNVSIHNVSMVSQVESVLKSHKDIVWVVFIGHASSKKINIGNGDIAGTNISSIREKNDVSPYLLDWHNLTPDATIDIWGCNAGSGSNSIAQDLANASNRTTFAYENCINFDDNGEPFIRWFRSGGRRRFTGDH